MPKSKVARSIAFRLSLAVVTSVLAGILISTSFFLVGEFQRTVDAERERLESSAAAFAAASSASVATGDRQGVVEVLRGIRDLSHVRYAEARDASGQVLGEIGGGAMLLGRDGSLAAKDTLSMFLADFLTVEAEVRNGGRVVGAIQLQAEIGWLRERYLHSLGLALGFGLLLMLVVALVSRAHIAQIIRPLKQLAGEFSAIGEGADLSKRLRHDRNDEIGVLVQAFNTMFERIDERDRLLQDHRDTLEETVALRTEEMRLARDDAERANAAKSDFLATMSHEIRTPMNGMMVMAELLAAAPLAQKHLRYAEIIGRSGRGLLNIINDILDFSKIEAGRLELEEVPFSLDTMVEDVASLFAERAREKGLSIGVHIAPDVPVKVIGDPTRLNQILTNLVNNALKFTETGGVTIEVTCSAVAVGSRVEMRVRDTGIGIAADKIDRIFERFSQADQTIARKFGGTGLGLSISRTLVDAMGGMIAVESEPGRGSEFRIAIPYPVAVEAAGAGLFGGAAVLVLDDDAITLAAAQATLASRGARVLVDTSEVVPVLILARSWRLAEIAADPRLRGARIVALQSFSGAAARSPDIEISGEIQLPLRRAEIDLLARCVQNRDFTPMNASAAVHRAPQDLADCSGLRVLAVDDTAVNREVLKEALSCFGIIPDLAESGVEAIEKATARAYDVIFMDCSMPGMDGFAATAEIRGMEQAHGRAPAQLVALTAHVSGTDASRWQDAGMDTYITKPFTIGQLTAIFSPLAGVSATVEAEDAPRGLQAMLPEAPGWQDTPLLDEAAVSMFAALSKPGMVSVADRVFNLFEAHAPRGLSDLCDNLDGDPSTGAKYTHALKSMCTSAGAQRAAAICQLVEDALSADRKPTVELLAALDQAIAETLAEAQQRFPSKRVVAEAV